ncbi:MAG TPA: AraC family transcriptional regulator [Firmicutes bacterium]|nr:AraC family transcriptional regulator [Bacillota bacterium]
MNSFYQLNVTEKEIPFVLFYDNGNSVVPSHWHKEIEIIYSLQGNTQMMINDRMFEVREGEIGIAIGGDIHFYLCSQNHRRMVVMFDLDIFEDERSRGKLKGEIGKLLENMVRVSSYWKPEQKRRVVQILKELEEKNTSTAFGRTLAIKARIYDLILILCNELPKSGSQFKMFTNINQTKMLSNLEKAITFVEQNYMHHLSLEDVAEALNFAPSYFARFFKRFTNTTFLSYLNTYRINKAQWSLINENKGITEISEDVGFGSVKTFNRLFKATTGMSPSEYRKSIFENNETISDIENPADNR